MYIHTYTYIRICDQICQKGSFITHTIRSVALIITKKCVYIISMLFVL